jgi:hypothetical protein
LTYAPPVEYGRALCQASRAHTLSLLAIAGVILLIVATVDLTINRSPVVAGIALSAVIIFGTLALIFIITAVSTPKESKPAALPHSVKLVTNNRRKMYVWVKVFAILLGIFALAALVPGTARIVALTIGGMTLFLAIILLPVLYWTSRTADKSLTETELNPWVHWLYTPDQWTQWSNVQVERLSATPPGFVLQRDWHRFLFPFAIIIGGVAFFCPGGWLFQDPLPGRNLHSHSCHRCPGWPRRRVPCRKTPRQADGGKSRGLVRPRRRLLRRRLHPMAQRKRLPGLRGHRPAPASLDLRFEKSVPNPYGPTQIVPIHQAVLIPANADGDLARCPKAQIALA